MIFTVLRFTESSRGQTRSKWVKTIAWGEGSQVKRVTFTLDRAEAARLSQVTALRIAEQFFTHRIALETQDGVPNVALTAQLLKSQMAKLQTRNEMVRKANEEMRAFWSEMVAAVPELAQFARLR